MRKSAAMLGALFAAAAAQAQPPSDEATGKVPEKIIVTAPALPPESVIDFYVKSRGAPSPALGKIARWADGVCPVTDGLPRRWADFISLRIRQIAAEVGAPVASKPGCKFNIEIAFTTAPQKLLDNIRAEHPLLLGYHYAPQEARLATVSHPIQAWYMTETEDLRGVRSADDASPHGIGMSIVNPLTGEELHLPDARPENVGQSRLGDGLRSVLYHTLIVADPTRLGNLEVGALADYIAMLALSQTDAYDTCQDAPSITNLLAPDCGPGRRPNAIADIDLAYLRALYRMDAGSVLLLQRGAIAQGMKDSLENR